MTDEEKKAIENIKTMVLPNENVEVEKVTIYKEPVQDIIKLLNLIEKQDKTIRDKEQIHEHDVKMIDEVKGEYVKQCKIIREMAEMLVKDHEWFFSEFDDYTAEDFIEYFEKKVGE